MKIIISPAKQMRVDDDAFDAATPQFIGRTKILLDVLQQMTLPELQKLWGCNDKIVEQNYKRIKNMQLDKNLTPAVLAYDGLQYTHMGPRVFETGQWKYVCENLRILSGFYGILHADDGVVPYRLEMQAKLKLGSCKNLYSFWGDSIYKALTANDKVILNLASKEYSKAVEPYLEDDVQFVTCVFACGTAESYRVKATEAKLARGSMVRWCAENDVQRVEDVRAFNGYGYEYRAELSSSAEYVFIKQEKTDM